MLHVKYRPKFSTPDLFCHQAYRELPSRHPLTSVMSFQVFQFLPNTVHTLIMPYLHCKMVAIQILLHIPFFFNANRVLC